MNTNDFALTILLGIKKFLAWIGIPSHMLDKMDELLFLIVIVIIAFIVAGIVHAVLVHLAKKDSETQTRRILRIDVQIRRISEA